MVRQTLTAPRRILLGICGGIAAYKVLSLIRLLRKDGAEVRVVMTAHACRFVTPLVVETLSGSPVYRRQFAARDSLVHISLREWADLLVVAPATANMIGKIANGIADDLLATLALGFSGPRLLCPAMNCEMWAAPALQRNLQSLRADGWSVVEPASGEQACGAEGPGRLPEPEALFAAVGAALPPGDRYGRLLVTAGATREPIDAVRFLSNHSTGRMGVAIAAAARRCFAEVVLVHGALSVPVPPGIRAVPAPRVAEMLDALRRELPAADALVMAAAVSDFTPRETHPGKLKKEGRDGLVLELCRTPDLLSETAPLRAGRVFTVGFAMETADHEENARRKMQSKDLDAILANPLGEPDAGFAVETNRLLWLGRDGSREDWGLAGKDVHAARLVERLARVLAADSGEVRDAGT